MRKRFNKMDYRIPHLIDKKIVGSDILKVRLVLRIINPEKKYRLRLTTKGLWEATLTKEDVLRAQDLKVKYYGVIQ